MHLSCDFYSEALQICVGVNVLVPQPQWGEAAGSAPVEAPSYPVLYLLHGLSDDQTIWHRRTGLERFVDALNVAVVMPAVNRSFYSDQADGYRYFSFVADELPQLVKKLLPISAARENTFVAGNSMGGYGAFKLALTYPERYGAAVSFSGALDISEITANVSAGSRFSKSEMERNWGDLDTLPGSSNDLLALLEKNAAKKQPLPALYACCGKDDFLLEQNHTFVATAKKWGIPLDYLENEGAHTWDYWDKMLPWAFQKMGIAHR